MTGRLRTAIVAAVAAVLLGAAGWLLLTAGDRVGDPAAGTDGSPAPALAAESGGTRDDADRPLDTGHGHGHGQETSPGAGAAEATPPQAPVAAVPVPRDAPLSPPGAIGPAVAEPEPVTYLLPDGSPAPGHDPANQEQVSLAEAASRPHGSSRPVSGAAGVPRGPVEADVSHDAPVNGCAPDYGTPGQCVPEQPPHAGHGGPTQWTCASLRTYFPDGITVHGEDIWGLDTNGDAIACGPGDA